MVAAEKGCQLSGLLLGGMPPEAAMGHADLLKEGSLRRRKRAFSPQGVKGKEAHQETQGGEPQAWEASADHGRKMQSEVWFSSSLGW
ncbi:hypothetical protein DSLASN_08410 [Desulfoluna limicola]|uniref:Uncharacterized protein n=1 Tax=Desulfoluna limicola TaxID=2810562 RepID=A0ABN6EXY4_9BACT|nr:hypothetical protein DSLASN_08410 [Desulfoluna limicola]